MVEHWIVVPAVAGSNPVIHPNEPGYTGDGNRVCYCASVAQLDRVPDFESVGRRFESCRAYINYQGR